MERGELVDWDDWRCRGRKYCENCKKKVIVRIGCAGKKWCRECNELLED